jgi:hypothetical protein
MTALLTASWWSLWQASKAGPLTVAPVRISRGLPKFWPAAERFPECPELMPPGWILGCDDLEKAERGYRHHLHRVGIERVSRILDAESRRPVPQTPHKVARRPLALACFERLTKPDEVCHRRWFARFWEEQTGVVVDEFAPPHCYDQLTIATTEGLAL